MDVPEVTELKSLVSLWGWGGRGVLCSSAFKARLLEVGDAPGRLNTPKALGTASCLLPRAPHGRDQAGSFLGTPALHRVKHWVDGKPG